MPPSWNIRQMLSFLIASIEYAWITLIMHVPLTSLLFMYLLEIIKIVKTVLICLYHFISLYITNITQIITNQFKLHNWSNTKLSLLVVFLISSKHTQKLTYTGIPSVLTQHRGHFTLLYPPVLNTGVQITPQFCLLALATFLLQF